MSKPEICCIFNYAPHYRAPIYTLMDQELNCDFYFGDSVGTPIKEMDTSKLNGFQNLLRRKKITRWNYFWHKGAIKPILKNYSYYIVSGDSKYLSLWLLLVIALFTKKKVFIWGHGIKGNKSYIQTKIGILFYKLADKVLLYSHFSRDQMLNIGFKKTKLDVIYNSLDYDKQVLYRNKIINPDIYIKRFKNKNPTIIYIGRLQKSKKLELLVTLVEKLKQSNKNVNLVFVGKNLGDTDLVTLVENKKLSTSVWFYGACYDELIISDLIQQADLCISPGPIGLTAIHVATYGLPIITNNDFKNQMPEFEIIKAGVNGDFYIKDDFSNLQEITKKWLFSKNEQREIAKNHSHKIVDTFYNPRYQLKLLKQITQE